MFEFITAYFVVFFLIYLIVVLSVKSRPLEQTLPNSPKVAILLAVRNEQKNLETVLKNLLNQDYDNYKIFVGNDNSEDKSEEIIKQFVEENSRKITYINITNNARAKQGVLIKLIEKIEPDTNYIVITDADIIHPEKWLKTLVALITETQADFLTHPTKVLQNSFFAAIQNTDWLQALATTLAFQKINVPTTAIGNNIIINFKTYKQIGGYEKLPFSLTEDFLLYKHFLKNNKKAIWSFNHNALLTTFPEKSIKKLLHQRKRWFVGAKQTHLLLKLYTIFMLLFPYLLFTSALISPGLFLSATLSYFFVSLLLQKRFYSINKHSFWTLIHPFYSIILNLLLFLSIIFNREIKWKERNYK